MSTLFRKALQLFGIGPGPGREPVVSGGSDASRPGGAAPAAPAATGANGEPTGTAHPTGTPQGASANSHATPLAAAPPASTPEAPGVPVVPGPFGPLHHVMSAFEREAGDPSWAADAAAEPLRPERMRADLCLAASARLRRLADAVAAGDARRLEEWARVDLPSYLDHLAGHYSDAVHAARTHAPAAAVRDRLGRLLFTEVSDAARHAGLFAVQPIALFATEFDSNIHHADGTMAQSGAPGRVVRVESVGRLDPAGRSLQTPARVIVGK